MSPLVLPPMARIENFSGQQYMYDSTAAKGSAYDQINVEYATSTYQAEHQMYPGIIAFPENDSDIQQAIAYANDNKCYIAIMSGGHQYSGACSTNQSGIQLNMKSYTGEGDLAILGSPPPPNDNMVLVSACVNKDLGTFNGFLCNNGLFVPHGQCTDVCIGGHAQTGGYGQLARSFGLLGDHVWGLKMFDYDGNPQEVSRTVNPELFNAILGGSPGNFGVITHYIFEVYKDADYYFQEPDGIPHGLKAVWLYNEPVLTALLGEVAAMADDADFPRNFDLCVSVFSHSYKLLALEPKLDGYEGQIPELVDEDPSQTDENATFRPSFIVLFAQWVPMSKDDSFIAQAAPWFQKFQQLATKIHLNLIARNLTEPMSKMTGEWLFTAPREFDYPYDKRAYLTNSRTLGQDNWVGTLVPQISNVVLLVKSMKSNYDMWHNCFLSAQIQCFGGNKSQFFVNSNNGTSYSWRDSTVGQTLDCFHTDTPHGLELATSWQARNDQLMVGQDSPFSKQDKRLLWASYGDWNMDNVWQYYYDDQEKYEQIGKQRAQADPNGTFTANPFRVAAVN